MNTEITNAMNLIDTAADIVAAQSMQSADRNVAAILETYSEELMRLSALNWTLLRTSQPGTPAAPCLLVTITYKFPDETAIFHTTVEQEYALSAVRGLIRDKMDIVDISNPSSNPQWARDAVRDHAQGMLGLAGIKD